MQRSISYIYACRKTKQRMKYLYFKKLSIPFYLPTIFLLRMRCLAILVKFLQNFIRGSFKASFLLEATDLLENKSKAFLLMTDSYYYRFQILKEK